MFCTVIYGVCTMQHQPILCHVLKASSLLLVVLWFGGWYWDSKKEMESRSTSRLLMDREVAPPETKVGSEGSFNVIDSARLPNCIITTVLVAFIGLGGFVEFLEGLILAQR